MPQTLKMNWQILRNLVLSVICILITACSTSASIKFKNSEIVTVQKGKAFPLGQKKERKDLVQLLRFNISTDTDLLAWGEKNAMDIIATVFDCKDQPNIGFSDNRLDRPYYSSLHPDESTKDNFDWYFYVPQDNPYIQHAIEQNHGLCAHVRHESLVKQRLDSNIIRLQLPVD